MGIVHYDESGLTLYARFSDGTSVALTPGSGVDATKYEASDSAIATAGLSAGTYSAAVKQGAVAGQLVTDPLRGQVDRFVWDGAAEVEELSRLDVAVSTRNAVTPAVAGDQMALTPTAQTALAGAVDAAFIDGGDGTDALTQIVAAIGNTNVNEAALVLAIRADIERTGGVLVDTLNNVLSNANGIGQAKAAAESCDTKLNATRLAAIDGAAQTTGLQPAAEAAIEGKMPSGAAGQFAEAGSSASNLDEVSGGGNNTISADDVSDKRTFFAGREGNSSRSIVTLTAASSGTVTLQVVPSLNDADINTTGTHSVTVVGQTTLTVTNVTTRKDGKALHFTIPADSAADTYTVTANIQTLDGNTIAITGKLVIE